MKDIKEKVRDQSPKIRNPASRLPKELVRSAMLETKEKTSIMADKIGRETGEESPVEYAGNRIERVEQRAGKESAFAAYRGGKKLAVKTYEKLKEQRQKQREAVTAPFGRGNRKRRNICPDRTGKSKERAHRSRTEHQGQTGSGENDQGSRKPGSKNSAPHGESVPGFLQEGENPGNLTKKTGSNIYEGGKGSKTGCHAFCPGSKTKRRGGKNNCQGAESYGGSCRPCGKGSFCSIDGRRWYGICDLDPYCRNHWRRFVYREFPEQRAAECGSPGPYPSDPAVCQ